MKNIIRYTILSILTLLLGSCGKDFLDLTPQDRVVADNFYRNEGEVRAATATLYGYPWFDFDQKFSWLAGDCMSGNLRYDFLGQDEGPFYLFTVTEGNSQLALGWQSLFRVISYANAIINDMPPIAKENVSQTIIDQALGEARFIRGVAYYILAEYWGEVPIVENSTALVTSNDLILPKNTRSSIYEFIRRDLTYASVNLKPTDDPGRVTQWSAKGMLSKLFLTMASDLDDPNSSSYFDSAKVYALNVIQYSGLELMPDYYDLFLIENNNNSESLFALQWIKGGYALGNARNANWARSSIIADQQWGSGKSVTYDFILDVEPGDARRRAIYMTLGDFYPELNQDGGGYTYNIVTVNPENPEADYLEGASLTLNHLKKFVVGSNDDTQGNVGTDQDAGINQPILRLADVYLIYAEASLGAAAISADPTALGYFNEIRSRADLAAEDTLTFQSILKERRVELALESTFWFDIKRYYYRDPAGALAYLNAQERQYTFVNTDYNDRSDDNTFEGYALTPPANPIVIYDAQMVLPVPAAEVLANPLLARTQTAVEYEFE